MPPTPPAPSQNRSLKPSTTAYAPPISRAMPPPPNSPTKSSGASRPNSPSGPPSAVSHHGAWAPQGGVGSAVGCGRRSGEWAPQWGVGSAVGRGFHPTPGSIPHRQRNYMNQSLHLVAIGGGGGAGQILQGAQPYFSRRSGIIAV